MRKAYFDAMKAVGVIAVVILHIVSASVYNSGTEVPPGISAVCSTIHICMNFAVPLFVMVSGALFLNSEKQFTFFSIFRYLRRILLCLLIFGMFYSMLELVFQAGTISPGNPFDYPPLVSIPILFAIIFGISFLCTYLLRKLTFVKRYIL